MSATDSPEKHFTASLLGWSATRRLSGTLGFFPSLLSAFLNFKGSCMAEPYAFICIMPVNKAICLSTWDPWVVLIPASRLSGGDKRGTYVQVASRRRQWFRQDAAVWGLFTRQTAFWIIETLVKAIYIKLIFWFSTKLLVAEQFISRTSHRCRKHLRATVKGDCLTIHMVFLSCVLGLAFLCKLCTFEQ